MNVQRTLQTLAAGAVLASVAGTTVAAAEPAIRSVEVVGTEFKVTREDGTVIRSEALVGTVLSIVGPDDLPMTVRIDQTERDAEDPDIVLHTFSVQDAGSGEWANLCQADPKGVRKGFPLRGGLAANGEYRPEAPGFSITCTLGVQAKCVRWGYKPWKPDPAGVRMIDLYRSCMRMARADYCGDGRPYTRNGTTIDLYDRVGIQRPEPASNLTFEAAWSPQGAICIRHTRIPENGSVGDVVRACPRLASMPAECDELAPGALLFNKSL